MADNSVFFPQEVLDLWVVEGIAELRPNEVILLKEGRRYLVEEAAFIIREVTGTGDPNELEGRVHKVSELTERGAEILEGSMILGDNAYDVASGWMGRSAEPFAQHLVSPARKMARKVSGTASDPDPTSDEDLLQRLNAAIG